MTSPAVRPPLTVLIRRFWRLAFRSQSASFKFIAIMSTVVLAVGVGTALVGFDDNTSRLHQADGPGANGGPGGQPTAPAAAPSQSAGTTKAGKTGPNATGTGSGNGSGNGGGTHGPAGCRNPAGQTDHGVSASKI